MPCKVEFRCRFTWVSPFRSESLLGSCFAVAAFACRATPTDMARTSIPASIGEPNSGRTPVERIFDGSAPEEREALRVPPAASATETHGAQPAALPPLSGVAEFIKLRVPGFLDAILFVPLGATSTRPVLVALHGNFDRPEWQCETWRAITDGYPFILCPRGIPRRDVSAKWDRWEYSSLERADRELEAGLQALHEEFSRYISPGPVLFTGFSLGAILGVGILKRHPGQYGPVVFSEGGNERWSSATVRTIAPLDADGGTNVPLRVLYACGQADCVFKSKATAKIIEGAGGQVRVVSGGNVGHMYDGPVAEAIKREWAWLIQDDPRWLPPN